MMAKVVTRYPRRVKVVENIFIPMSDGTRLAAKLWLPADAETDPVPAIIEYVPYRKREGTRVGDHARHAYFAGHGYACLRLDIRGSGDSDGIITDEYTKQEQRDGVEAIAWIAAQNWCDGGVAMIGLSWGGFNGLQIAALQPPELKTIITIGSTDDRYATDVHWVGGCLSKDNFDWSSTMMANNDLPPDPEIVGKHWRAMWQERLEHNEPWILTWMKHQRRDAYWQQGSVCEDFSKITIPVYAVNGWADNYAESIPRLLEGLSGPRKGLIGPWAHSFPNIVTVGEPVGWLQEALRWFDHWMKDKDTGIMDEPMYRVWMQESQKPQTCYTQRPGRWVAEESWPSPRIDWRKLRLNAEGTPSNAKPGELGGRKRPLRKLTLCSPLTVGAAAGEIGRYGGDADWSTDQREDDGGSLVFVSAPLKDRTEILGAPQLRLQFSSDKELALVSVRLNDVAPDGASQRVTVGLLNLTHRDSHEKPTPLKPGKVYEAVVDLDDIAHAFRKGHRIAVSISTTYWPIAWPSPEAATLTILSGESYLDLPVRPLRRQDAKLPPFGPAEKAPSTPYIDHPLESKTRRRVTRDLLSGKMQVDFPRWTYKKEFTDIGMTVTSEGNAIYTITDGDPLSAKVTTDNYVELARKDTTIRHHSWGNMTCSKTHFIIEMHLEAHEKGKLVFERSWKKRIKRDLV
jgi:putative CocE/NonD family hydrolase